MYNVYRALLAFVAIDFSAAFPHPLVISPPPVIADRYYIDSQDIVDGTPINGGLSVIQGGVLQVQEQYSIAYTVEVGVDLGLNIDDIIGAGIGVSVSKTTETAISESAAYTCPDGAWTCALQIVPSVVRVRGHRFHYKSPAEVSNNYEVTIPRTDSIGNAVVEVTICSCHNRLAWADSGAPPRCFHDCS